ncbi:E6 [Pygoscelis adeliae papillomavirus 1]|uniref:E6 n=1 Tax=Pygoscelis adeliae papillomavirus 1 TaxID=1480065 RepID=X2JGU2_9PAPI|nr:E6 [Pygoscelis adeliae papillomavirus 1]AHN65798.1 E6 [Pygoscelis adeliae papillomavirus 1]
MPFPVTLGQLLYNTRRDLLDICILCRMCHTPLTAEEILQRELEDRESNQWHRAPFCGVHTDRDQVLWLSLCNSCITRQRRRNNRCNRYAYPRPFRP